MQSNDIVLWVSVAVLMLGVALWAQRRGASARARAERARREAARENLGGDSYFLPPAPIEQAVELANPVEIESLLAGESETVAQVARQQLEAPTDIGITGSLRELSLSLGSAAPPPLAVASARRVAPIPAAAPAARPVAAAAPRPAAGAPPAAPAKKRPPTTDEIIRIPARELVLAWFEARGYRASTPLSDAHPIELVLRHRKDISRMYAFIVERNVVSAERAAALLAKAREAGIERLLIAAEAGSEENLPKKVQRYGIRIFDEPAIRAELRKIDIGVAAKIIAVARGRALAWRSAPTAPFPRPHPNDRRRSAA